MELDVEIFFEGVHASNHTSEVLTYIAAFYYKHREFIYTKYNHQWSTPLRLFSVRV